MVSVVCFVWLMALIRLVYLSCNILEMVCRVYFVIFLNSRLVAAFAPSYGQFNKESFEVYDNPVCVTFQFIFNSNSNFLFCKCALLA